MLRHRSAADLGSDHTKAQKIGPVSSTGINMDGWMEPLEGMTVGKVHDRWKFYMIRNAPNQREGHFFFDKCRKVTTVKCRKVAIAGNHFVLLCQLVHLLLGINVKYIGICRRLVVFLEAFRRQANLQSLCFVVVCFVCFRSQMCGSW